jgi:anti-anti-sigma factor
MRLFDVDDTPRGDADVSLVLRGELDLSTVEQLEREVSSRVDGRPDLVVVDLRELTFLDSTGLRLMLRLHGHLQSTGGRLVLVKGPQRVQRVFELTGATDELEIVEDPQQASRQNRS